MSSKPIFPEPWESAWGEGDIALGQQDEVRLAADASEDGTVRVAIERITKAMRERDRHGSEAEDAAHADIVLALDATAVEFADKNAAQAYLLRAADNRALIEAAAPVGLLYGAVTLAHLVSAGDGNAVCPQVLVRDRPDLARRGLFCESRWGPDQMTLDDWKDAVDDLVDLKFNMLTIGIYNCWPIQYYGQVSEFFFVPMQTTAMKRAESAEEPSAGRAVPLLLMVFVAFTIGSFFILLVSLMG